MALAVLTFCFATPLIAGQEVFDHTYADFAAILQSTVSESGRIDYRQLKSGMNGMNAFLSRMAIVDPGTFHSWSREEQLAFLINLYNAHTMALVARHYPVKSIKDIGNLWRGPWGQPVVGIFGKRTSLDYLSNQLIPAAFKDPSIRFALHFAAVSAPPLRQQPYRADTLEQALREQSRNFLSDSRNVAIVGEHLSLSEMFKWHAGEFGKNHGEVISFIEKNTGERFDVEALRLTSQITYQPFDWSLNDWLR